MTPSVLHRLIALTFAALTAASTAAYAADEAPAASDPLASARAQIAQKSWSGAIAELKRINATENADWNNLMGYSHRKAKTPDLEAAERYYDTALRIDPKHRGALEYSGELYLQLGQIEKAEQRLATLNKACFLPCSEYTELKKAVERYKAGGWQP
jgi:tetratricopeptide (TPR) repeat protein